MEGRVFKSTGSWYEVHTANGEVLRCRLRGKFKQHDLKTNNPIAVGDYVVLEMESAGEETAVIVDIKPRANYIIRKSTRKKGFAHILASNLDQAMLMATLTSPRTSLGFIDRFLVSAESFRIPATIVINKSDLLSEEGVEYANELKELYQSLGYESIFISVLEKQGLDELEKLLKNKTTLIAGHSGVGKSSLLNHLIPGLEQSTGAISDFANKGTHTTTFAEMFEVEDGTFVIDTPGIKELGLFDMNTGEIGHYFPEVRALIGECRFHNCTHTNEPHCAVLDAIESGDIATSRFNSYLSILEDHDNRR